MTELKEAFEGFAEMILFCFAVLTIRGAMEHIFRWSFEGKIKARIGEFALVYGLVLACGVLLFWLIRIGNWG